MIKLTINSKQSLSKAIGTLRETFDKAKYFTLSIKTGKKRTLNQNAILHAWCEQVSLELGEHTPMQIKCLVKYHIACPMLRADEYYNDTYLTVIDALPAYENKIKALEFFPATSLMDTKQLNRVLEAMQHNYADRVTLNFE